MTDTAPITRHDAGVLIRGDGLPLLYRACLALIARRHRSHHPTEQLRRPGRVRRQLALPRHQVTPPSGESKVSASPSSPRKMLPMPATRIRDVMRPLSHPPDFQIAPCVRDGAQTHHHPAKDDQPNNQLIQS